MARLSDTYELRCAYCHQAFVPAKRGTQRFCSGSCRTTYCKKKKAGTLGRVTKLKGPGQRGAPTSFAKLTLASAAGALAANTVTQGAEYYLVTKDLVAQVTQLSAQVQRLQTAQAASEARHEANMMLLGRGILTMLVQAGLTEAEARAAITTPFGRPTPVAESPGLPTPAGEALASAVPPAATAPISARGQAAERAARCGPLGPAGAVERRATPGACHLARGNGSRGTHPVSGLEVESSLPFWHWLRAGD